MVSVYKNPYWDFDIKPLVLNLCISLERTESLLC